MGSKANKSEWERDCGMSTIAMKTLQHVKMIDVNVKFQDNYYFTWHDNPLLASSISSSHAHRQDFFSNTISLWETNSKF